MHYNKNIILEILQSNFWPEIESFIEGYIMDMDPAQLSGAFEETADFALLDSIEEIDVLDFHIEKDTENDEEMMDGILSVVAMLEGYTYWDGEHVFLGIEDVELDFHFAFLKSEDRYSDLRIC